MNPLSDHTAVLPRTPGLARDHEQAQWFAAEVLPHEPALRHWLRHRFPWLLAEVDDLVQECFLRVLRARREGRVFHAKSYLFQTARNAALDQARRKQVVEFESIANPAELPVIQDVADAAEILSHDEQLEILAAAIEALPRRCRLVVKLRKLRGLSYQEIAAQMEISVHTVNAQLTKGIALCREYLRKHGVEQDDT